MVLFELQLWFKSIRSKEFITILCKYDCTDKQTSMIVLNIVNQFQSGYVILIIEMYKIGMVCQR